MPCNKAARGDPLVESEEKILEMLGKGYRQYEIAPHVGMHVVNVSRRARMAQIKLGCQTVVEAAVKYDRMKRTKDPSGS